MAWLRRVGGFAAVGGVLVCAALAGCGGSTCTANCTGSGVAGDYTVQLTNGTNGCNFSNWTVGNTTSGISVDVTQPSGSNAVSAVVTGGSGLVLDVEVGAHTLTGTVSDGQLSLMLNGTTAMHQSNCTYTIVANLSATQQGDALMGTITYTASTNMSPDCGTLQGCQTLQNFNGTRPPAAP